MGTPDPLFTTEQLAAFAAALVTNIVVLFGLDFSAERQAAIVGVVSSVWVAFTLYHAARVRGSRAIGAEGVAAVKKP